jgi:hypothetical protein
MNFQIGDLIKLENNKTLLNYPEWQENVKCHLHRGDVVITLSDIVNNGFINVITKNGIGWLYKESCSLKKI